MKVAYGKLRGINSGCLAGAILSLHLWIHDDKHYLGHLRIPQIWHSAQYTVAAAKMLLFTHVSSHHIVWTACYLLGCSAVLLPFSTLPASFCLKRPVYITRAPEYEAWLSLRQDGRCHSPTEPSPRADITNQSLHSVFWVWSWISNSQLLVLDSK